MAVAGRHGPLLAARGDVSVRQGNLSAAWQLYTQAAAADAGCARAYLGLANLDLLERRNRSARQRLERAHALDPDDPEILLAWASTLAGSRERLAAVERYLAIGTNEAPSRLAAVRALRATWSVLGERRTSVIAAPDRRYRLDLREGRVVVGVRVDRGAFRLHVAPARFVTATRWQAVAQLRTAGRNIGTKSCSDDRGWRSSNHPKVKRCAAA